MDNGLLRIRHPVLCGLSAAALANGSFLSCCTMFGQQLTAQYWIFSLLPAVILLAAVVMCIIFGGRNYAVSLAPVYCFFVLQWANSFGLGIYLGSGEKYSAFLESATAATWGLAVLFCLLDFLCLFTFAAADRSDAWKHSHIASAATNIVCITVCRLVFPDICADILPAWDAHVAVLAATGLLVLSLGKYTKSSKPFRTRPAAIFGMALGGLFVSVGCRYLFVNVAPESGYLSVNALITYGLILIGLIAVIISARYISGEAVKTTDWQQLLDDEIPQNYDPKNRTGLTDQFNVVREYGDVLAEGEGYMVSPLTDTDDELPPFDTHTVEAEYAPNIRDNRKKISEQYLDTEWLYDSVESINDESETEPVSADDEEIAAILDQTQKLTENEFDKKTDPEDLEVQDEMVASLMARLDSLKKQFKDD